MDNFEPVFNRAEKHAIGRFENFRDQYDAYHFLLPVGPDRAAPDHEAIGIAVLTDLPLATAYLAKIKPDVGYAKREDYVPLDAIDSRHLMMSTLIFSKLGRRIRNIVEIGGGFGNWVRLNEGIIDFDSWKIIDLPFVCELQRWYLSRTLYQSQAKVRVVAVNDVADFVNAELTIAAHSLSELSHDTFTGYVDGPLRRTRYLFYAANMVYPSRDSALSKLEVLDERFKRISETWHYGGQVVNILYERKQA